MCTFHVANTKVFSILLQSLIVISILALKFAVQITSLQTLEVTLYPI